MDGFECEACGEDTSLEYYMVDHDLWDLFGVGDGLLCIGCLEAKLGRELTKADFTDCLLNEPDMGWEKSDRLIDRLLRVV